LANDLIVYKKLSLIAISKFFNKLNQVYKQAGQERQNIKKIITDHPQAIQWQQFAIFDKQGSTEE
jgi:hypothetical protein